MCVSAYDVDPFEVPDADKTGLLTDLSERLLAADGVEHVQTSVHAGQGAEVLRRHGRHAAPRSSGSASTRTFDRADRRPGHRLLRDACARSPRRPGRGWEYLTGTGWDWDAELAEIPELLRGEDQGAVGRGRPLRPGHRPVQPVADHPRVDRARHRARPRARLRGRLRRHVVRHASTSSARCSTARRSCTSPATGRREHGLSTVGWDDEGVAGQQWDIVRDGVLVGYQVDRNMARLRGLPRSNGCAFADSRRPRAGAAHGQRVAAAGGRRARPTEELIGGVDRGIYVVGDKSWSIDMQRYNFQFTGQRFYRIEGGRLAGQLRDVAYQATTTDFWGSMRPVGGPRRPTCSAARSTAARPSPGRRRR